MQEQKKQSVYDVLSAINVNDKVEKKNGLTYLSWAWAWAEVKKHFPDASYKILNTDYDPALGYMCNTEVTIEGQTLHMWLPVLDGANKPMKSEPYTYWTKVWESGRKVDVEKEVLSANMFDINKTIMRCLVKNLAMFGLGLYIYAGEDLPESDSAAPITTAGAASTETAPKKEARKGAAKASAKGAVKAEGVDVAAGESLIVLKKDDENWAKVVKYVTENSALGLDRLLQQLSRKYSVPPATRKEIEALISNPSNQ